ncbi:MAG: helix-turn-helix transcriptional regulator [Acidobacteriota bacterium]|nr:helix-turn-helix transcriptional regulator [Acidobacteriota bacterium]
MFPQERQIVGEIDSETYTLGENVERPAGAAMSLVTLSHTPLECRLYSAMLMSSDPSNTNSEVFTVRRLTEITGITSLSTIRRGLEGLVGKFSVERGAQHNGNGARGHSVRYRVFKPEEVIARRDERGMPTYAKGIKSGVGNRSFERVVERVLEKPNLSRREAQVALCCVEGLTNAEIGLRLQVSEQTVKFHLRNIFVKFGVKRRAELISRLLM